MNILIAGTRVESLLSFKPEYIKWYLDILHNASPIKKLILVEQTTSGTNRVARDWAEKNQVCHSVYPSPDKSIAEAHDEIDICLCFPASYQKPRSSWKIRNMAKELGIKELTSPVADSQLF